MRCTTDDILIERELNWFNHPILEEAAVLPTRPVRDAIARVLRISRKARSSIAFWAEPVTGKSFCIQAIVRELKRKFPDAGVVLLESVDDRKAQAEGRLLTQILTSIKYVHKIDRDLAIKRMQVNGALIALSGSARRIFIIIDEAQEVTDAEFVWLKAVINGLCAAGIKVMTILFGQRELVDRQTQLKQNGRSDLNKRFMDKLLKFHGLRSLKDLGAICESLDVKSEFPVGSGWCYTEFLLPKAFAAGFRFAAKRQLIWERMRVIIPPAMLNDGLPMDMVAAFLANIAIRCKCEDAPGFDLGEVTIDAALKDAIKG